MTKPAVHFEYLDSETVPPGIPPFAEVPVETVYAVVAEFLTTWAPPTRVEWKEAASPLSRFE